MEITVSFQEGGFSAEARCDNLVDAYGFVKFVALSTGRATEAPAPQPTAAQTVTVSAEGPATEAQIEAPASEPEAQKEPEPAPEKELTQTDVVAKFTVYMQKVGIPEGRALLEKFGVKRVSELGQDRFAEFVAEMN